MLNCFARQTKYLVVVAIAAGAIWVCLRIRRGQVRIPDFLMAAVAHAVNGPPARIAPTNRHDITIELGSMPRALVNSRFLSVAIDTSLVVGGRWWSASGSVEAVGHQSVDPIDLGQPLLRDLARQLQPAYLRIGGTDADRITYAVSASASDRTTRSSELVLTEREWRG